ncbi:MAG: arsenite methyltransferase [Candidatus Promineifilaceae bacterium]|nr:arsenite methyltransferase [Candidatus Promineifilaceae bacterium]
MATPDEIHDVVRDHYGRLAESTGAEADADCGCGCGDGDDDCCTSGPDLYALETGDLPAEITGLSLGCGDPVTLAELRPGQTVLDLGSGGGLDCFLAARAVGPEGTVIGVDMTSAMIERANQNKEKVGLENVEFRLGEIEALPLEAETVDVVISNCVVNLSPDKAAVFREAFRVLRPGGRLSISDMVTQGHFSEEERADLSAWAGCITGAEDVGDYVAWLKQAGFTNISIRDKEAPGVELAGTISLESNPRLFSARITAEKTAK